MLADPVFTRDDPRIAQRGGGPQPIMEALERSAGDVGLARLTRLLGMRREADAIVTIAGGQNVLRADGFDAGRELALSGRLSSYRIVHFATHGFIDSRRPELSGLVLSMVDRRGRPSNGFLQAHDVYNVRLPADLVVLSGCQTALGAEVRGEGMIGLTRAFMYAGTPRVIASLWNVSDVATANLMRALYAAMLTQGLHPAAALRAAQNAVRQQRAAPYYWAGFVLQGEMELRGLRSMHP